MSADADFSFINNKNRKQRNKTLKDFCNFSLYLLLMIKNKQQWAQKASLLIINMSLTELVSEVRQGPRLVLVQVVFTLSLLLLVVALFCC